jgi:hypothetical protein
VSTATITKCDICGRERGPSNHWHQVWLRYPDAPLPVFTARGYLPNPDNGTLDVCGAECATKAFQRFLATGRLDEAERKAE